MRAASKGESCCCCWWLWPFLLPPFFPLPLPPPPPPLLLPPPPPPPPRGSKKVGAAAQILSQSPVALHLVISLSKAAYEGKNARMPPGTTEAAESRQAATPSWNANDAAALNVAVRGTSCCCLLLLFSPPPFDNNGAAPVEPAQTCLCMSTTCGASSLIGKGAPSSEAKLAVGARVPEARMKHLAIAAADAKACSGDRAQTQSQGTHSGEELQM